MRRASRWGAEIDRIISMVNGANLDDRLFASPRSVVSSVFAEGPFITKVIKGTKTFQSDFTGRRDRQAGHFAANHRHALSRNGTQIFEFRNAVRDAHGATIRKIG